MSVIKTSARMTQPQSTSETFIQNNADDSQARVTLLQLSHIKPQHQTIKTTKNVPSTANRTPDNLLELKRQRLVAAADRKKRLITRIISIVGLLIILLCAVIVALTLKMAPKIDELVRTKGGVYSSVHLTSRLTTPSMTTRITSDNSTTNNSPLMKSTFRTRRRSFSD